MNRFLIKYLFHKLNFLCHLPLSSIIDDKIGPPPLFNPVSEKIFDPPPLLSTPLHLQNITTPTSILTIRSLLYSLCYFILIYYLVYLLYYGDTCLHFQYTIIIYYFKFHFGYFFLMSQRNLHFPFITKITTFIIMLTKYQKYLYQSQTPDHKFLATPHVPPA